MTDHQKVECINAVNTLVDECHLTSVQHGFYSHSDDINVPEKLCLIHSEISEALETHRTNASRADDHCPEHMNFTIELADAIIRICDLAGALGLNLGQAIVDKMAYNKSRPFRHGKSY